MRTFAAQLATLVKSPPEGDAWLHELKYDGYRLGCSIEGRRAVLWSAAAEMDARISHTAGALGAHPLAFARALAALLARERSDHFTMRNQRARLDAMRRDPWREYFDCRQKLPRT